MQDIELNHSGWTTPDVNVAWLQRAVKAAVDQLGVERVGIYTSRSMHSAHPLQETTEPIDQWRVVAHLSALRFCVFFSCHVARRNE